MAYQLDVRYDRIYYFDHAFIRIRKQNPGIDYYDKN
jgi:hypothetical protein